MKVFIVSLLLICSTVHAQTTAATQPHFPSLKTALIWLDLQLDAEDFESIRSTLRNPRPLDSQSGILRSLISARGSTPLAILFKDRSFPADKDRFKLGGHDKELGHIHIDFIKVDGLWFLDSIWMCR